MGVSTTVERVPVTDPLEYQQVHSSFRDTLRGGVNVQSIERIQNLAMWQSYAVKAQTTHMRDRTGRVNNHGDLERKWLFHGTSSDTIPLIINQGFNRAFAGKNAVAYGRGVYFARDSAYSDNYAAADAHRLKQMFMCRVVVGDWCKGRDGALTLETKPGGSLELFDTTVDDIRNPSIFVCYHDSQAYPEYLVTYS